jgi:hypothetical protein
LYNFGPSLSGVARVWNLGGGKITYKIKFSTCQRCKQSWGLGACSPRKIFISRVSETSFPAFFWDEFISEYISHTQFLPRYWEIIYENSFGTIWGRGVCLPHPPRLRHYPTSVLGIKTINTCSVKLNEC